MIQHLPAELIEKIFLYAYPLVRIHDVLGQGSTWTLEQVCVQWHSIATSYKRLWSTMDIDVERSRFKRSQTTNNLLLCLQRTGNHPLSVLLHDAPGANSRSWMAIVDILIPHCHRWRTFTCHFPLQYFTESYREEAKGRLSALKQLNIVAEKNYARVPIFAPSAMFKDTPSLSHLSIDGLYGFRRLNLPWTQLQEISLENIQYVARSRFWEGLKIVGPTLKKLTLRKIVFGSTPYILMASPSERVIQFTMMYELSIAQCESMNSILQDISCPQLRSLALQLDEASTSIIPLSDFLHRSHCRLDQLYLKSHPFLSLPQVLALPQVANIAQLALEFQGTFTSENSLREMVSLVQSAIVPSAQLVDQVSGTLRFLKFTICSSPSRWEDEWVADCMRDLRDFCVSRGVKVALHDLPEYGA